LLERETLEQRELAQALAEPLEQRLEAAAE
jgi:hypothetical protein